MMPTTPDATPAPPGGPVVDAAIERAVAAFARAVRLSCLAAGGPEEAGVANDAVAAHVAARAWAEEAVRRAGRGRPGA